MSFMVEFCCKAISDENFRLIESCYEPGNKDDDRIISDCAASVGNLKYLTWLHENGCSMGIHTFKLAIESGPHLECAHYLMTEVLSNVCRDHTTVDGLVACMRLKVPNDDDGNIIKTLEEMMDDIKNNDE